MPPKAKADTAGYQKLKKDLSAGTPGQLYLLHGEETYLRDYYLGKLREKVLAGGLEEFNFHPIAAKDMSPHALEEAIDCLPMMAERTLVQVTDFDLFKAGEKDREAYGKLLSQLPDYVCLVFVFDLVPFKMDARTKFSAVIKQAGTVVNFVRQDQGDLVDWVRRRFRALGKDIDSKLALDLIFLCGDLMTNLIGEIEKIGAYAKGVHITRQALDAVAARLALEQGRGPSYVAALWGIKPYPAEKLVNSARRFTLGWCRKAVVRCGQVDLAMKSTGQDGQELLTGLLLELATPAAPKAARRY